MDYNKVKIPDDIVCIWTAQNWVILALQELVYIIMPVGKNLPSRLVSMLQSTALRYMQYSCVQNSSNKR